MPSLRAFLHTASASLLVDQPLSSSTSQLLAAIFWITTLWEPVHPLRTASAFLALAMACVWKWPITASYLPDADRFASAGDAIAPRPSADDAATATRARATDRFISLSFPPMVEEW